MLQYCSIVKFVKIEVRFFAIIFVEKKDMSQTNLTFDQLPAAVTLLLQEVSAIKIALQAKPVQEIADQLYTVQQASEFLSLAIPTMYAIISRGEIANLKRGKRVYFQKSDLIKYLEAGRRNTKRG